MSGEEEEGISGRGNRNSKNEEEICREQQADWCRGVSGRTEGKLAGGLTARQRHCDSTPYVSAFLTMPRRA